MRSTDLRSCSLAAKGLWIDMLCLMHEGNPYGTLKVGDKVILPAILARMVGVSLHEVEGYLQELIEAGVCSTDISGCIFSRRMIRDEEIRAKRAAGGIDSQNNPNVPRKKDKVEGYPSEHPSPQSFGVSPASASASSSSLESKPLVASKLVDNCPHEEILKMYHEILPELAGVIKMDEKRKVPLRKRWREDKSHQTIDFWARFFKYVYRHHFLMGRLDGKPWQADFDFIVGNKFQKIIEGGYESWGMIPESKSEGE